MKSGLFKMNCQANYKIRVRLKNILGQPDGAHLGSLFRKEKTIYVRSGIIEALMIEFPSRIKNRGELFDYLDTKEVPVSLVEAFISGLIWREPKAFWESHHGVINEGVHAYVLSKELCEAFDLSSRPQTFDLYDKSNRRASITVKWGVPWHTYHRLIYLRQDLLERYLQNRGLELVWGVWGERRYKSKDNAGLHEFAEKHQSYKVFEKIITYRDIIEQHAISH